MRLLSLDYDPVYGADTVRARFNGDVSVFDFDVVVWDPAGSFENYQYDYSKYYQNLPSLDENTSVQIKADSERRRSELLEFVNSGRNLVVIVRPPQRCFVDTGSRSYSGTGRNRLTTINVLPFDLMTALPVADPGFALASGTRIEFNGDGPIVALLRKYKKYVSYDAVMKSAPGVAIGHVAGTDRIIGSVLRAKKGGHVILMPSIDFRSSDYDPADEDSNPYVEEASDFQRDLLAAMEQLDGSRVTARPGWAQRFSTEKQEGLALGVAKQQGRVETARAKLTKLQQLKEAAEAVDQLYLGTGRALELEVKEVLELLGGKVSDPEPGRDDWRVKFPEGLAVVEVKGVTKTAAEKHAAQLEKWVSGVMEETGTLPKGILVVNTWRETPLDERTQDDFPAQMLPYSASRGHCLVTGLQLFVIRADVEQGKTRAVYWRKEIMRTAGKIEGCDDWRSVIHENNAAVDE